ncbi:hypothetical protein ACVWXO_002497 [Bradyrhizobium sp. LM2.7]
MSDFWVFVGLAVAFSAVAYIANDFRARLGRIEGKLNRILDRVYPEEAEERQEQGRLALEAKIVREGRWAWPLLILWLLGVGGWLLLRPHLAHPVHSAFADTAHLFYFADAVRPRSRLS